MTADRSSTDAAASGGPVRGGAADRRAAARALPDRVAILGLGLIGGSIAAALRQAEYPGRIAAWSPSGHGPTEGHRSGLVDDVATSATQALEAAGLVVLAGPPVAVLEALDGVAAARRDGALGADATITDVASTKARIVTRAADLELPFIGGHPMAGREVSGIEAAEPELFVDRPWVIVPAPHAANQDVVRVSALAWATGARPLQLTAEAHDAAVAAISHLPLALAAALVESVVEERDWPVARSLAAGGWASATRVAKGDPAMGAGILATNAPAVAGKLRALRAAIDSWLELLEGEPNREALQARLAAVRDALQVEAE